MSKKLLNAFVSAVIDNSTFEEMDTIYLSNRVMALVGEAVTEEQEKLYAILGDVNPEYALKYMTSFLLKFLKKEEVQQKRRDIFVDSLEILGYIRKNDEGKYELVVDLDQERLMFSKQ